MGDLTQEVEGLRQESNPAGAELMVAKQPQTDQGGNFHHPSRLVVDILALNASWSWSYQDVHLITN